jgi:hypothetical protein
MDRSEHNMIHMDISIEAERKEERNIQQKGWWGGQLKKGE